MVGTTGIGSYETYRYGIRWFGDYRGAVPGAAHTYCIDLRYWYPSRAYRFREDTSGTLRNRDGETVSLPDRVDYINNAVQYLRSAGKKVPRAITFASEKLRESNQVTVSPQGKLVAAAARKGNGGANR